MSDANTVPTGKYRSFHRKLALNILLGLAIEALLTLYHHHPHIESIENIAFDTMLKFYRDTAPRRYAAKPFYGTSALATFFWNRLDAL